MKLSMKSGVLTFAAACLLVLVNIAGFKLVPVFLEHEERSVMGGELGIDFYDEIDDIKDDYVKPDDDYIERFLRPSSSKPVDKKYSFSAGDEELEPYQKPYEVIRAYFGIVSDASNLGVKKGGCGSIGFEKMPYTQAYKLLSQNLKKRMTYEKFLKSFEGIGHINLLKLVDMPAVKVNGQVYPRCLVEIETIEGSEIAGKTYFGYYYGYITAVQEGEQGWKIETIELKPEDFLCHAYHGWWHDAGTLVDAIYIKKYGVMEKVLGVEEDDTYRNVIAKGKDKRQYRFLFIRLTNGADIELRQYVMADGKWVDTRINAPEQN